MLQVFYVAARMSDALSLLARPPVKTVPVAPRTGRWAPRQEGLAAAMEEVALSGDFPTSLSGVFGAELLLILLLGTLSLMVLMSTLEIKYFGFHPLAWKEGLDRQLDYAGLAATVS